MKLKNRILEIDILRAIAVLLMIFYHFIFDLEFLQITILQFTKTFFWKIFPGSIGFVFIFLAGIAVFLNYQKHKNINRIRKHGIKIFLYGLCLTILSFLIYPQEYIRFGILHLIGSSIFVSTFLIKNQLAIVFSVFGIFFLNPFITKSICSDLFSFFGCSNPQFSSLDYYPIFPWFGFFLLGIIFGQILYKNKQTYFPKLNEAIQTEQNFFSKILKILVWSGQKSLMIYFLHQPILITLLWIWSKI